MALQNCAFPDILSGGKPTPKRSQVEDPDKFSIGWKFVRLGIPFKRNHANRKKI